MKELTIEEKAKRFDEALERAKGEWIKNLDNAYKNYRERLEIIFPELKDELKEIEEEKMWKLIKKYVHYNISDTALEVDHITREQLESWLEKQGNKVDNANKVEPKFNVGDTMRTLQEANNGYTDGMPVVVSIDNEYYHCTNELIAIKDQDNYEFPPINVKQKPADNTEPKFHEGEYIVFNGMTLYVKEVVKGFYRTISKGGITNSYDWDIDNIARLWNIADAKDGDVLSCDSKYGQEIGIVKKYIGKYGGCDKCFETYCFVDWDGIFRVGEYMGSQNIHPATKEQRELLFQKMKEAGYEWDEKKKELRKIEQKSKWTDEDDYNWQCCIAKAERDVADYYTVRNKELLEWLQSLKQRMIE